MIIDPRQTDPMTWFDRTAELLARHVPVMKLESLNDWKEWAAYMTSNTTVQRGDPPDPYPYEDWQEWAFDFNDSISELV